VTAMLPLDFIDYFGSLSVISKIKNVEPRQLISAPTVNLDLYLISNPFKTGNY